MSSHASDVADAIERLREAGVEAWDGPAIDHLERGIAGENAPAFAAHLAARLDEAKSVARASLAEAVDAGAIDDVSATRLEVEIACGEAFEAIVEIDLAVACRRADRPSRAAWIAALRSRAEARHLAVDDDDAIVGALIGDVAATTRAAKTILRGRGGDEDAGPYHAGALVNALLVELGTLSPSLLAARLAQIDDVARVLSMTGAPPSDRASVRPKPRR
ncbi:MAG: hypothetical protein ACHREM_27100 [Polyangiales bacterium]